VRQIERTIRRFSGVELIFRTVSVSNIAIAPHQHEGGTSATGRETSATWVADTDRVEPARRLSCQVGALINRPTCHRWRRGLQSESVSVTLGFSAWHRVTRSSFFHPFKCCSTSIDVQLLHWRKTSRICHQTLMGREKR